MSCGEGNKNSRIMDFVLFVVLLIVQLKVSLSEECLAYNNIPGTCTLDSECHALKQSGNNRRDRDAIMKRRCGFSGLSMVVCCPIETDSRIDLNSEPSKNQDSNQIDDDCLMYDNMPGVCKLDSECLLTASTKMHKILILKRCGFSGRSMIVCCPEDSVGEIRSRSISRKSDLACKNLGKRPIQMTSRLIGGSQANQNEFPQFAALGYKNVENEKISFDCGGVLVSSKFILTAAHCCRKPTRKPCIARIGKSIIDDEDDDSDYQVKEITVHPDYGSFKKYNDIALIELMESVPLSFNIWPACLIQQETVENHSLIIAGFGQMNLVDTTITSNVLLKARVEEIPLERCRNRYKNAYGVESGGPPGLPEGIKDTLLCARNRTQHADTCRGDSGTGLYLLQNETYFVAGVTSFGVSCNTSLPAFYTRVYKYLDWIENIVWKDLY